MENPNTIPCSEEQTAIPKSHIFFKDVFETVITGLILVLILSFCFFSVCTVVGSSMSHTLENGEVLIISDLFYSPKENDIVVFHETQNLNEPVIKRVIATGNKWVKIDYDAMLLYVSEDDVFDSSEIVDESSYVFFDSGEYDMNGSYEVFVPEGFIFVMGDNRNNSLDSRSPAIGLVDERTILGKVIIRISPFNKFGFLD